MGVVSNAKGTAKHRERKELTLFGSSELFTSKVSKGSKTSVTCECASNLG